MPADDLAAEGDRLHAPACRRGELGPMITEAEFDFFGWACENWPAIAAALRERDEQIPLESENERLRVRAETAEAELIAARHSRDEFHRLWERERVRAATAEADAALAWYWVDTLKDNTTCSEQREHLEADQAAHRARIAGAGAE